MMCPTDEQEGQESGSYGAGVLQEVPHLCQLPPTLDGARHDIGGRLYYLLRFERVGKLGAEYFHTTKIAGHPSCAEVLRTSF
jgi:hypothetical protein